MFETWIKNRVEQFLKYHHLPINQLGFRPDNGCLRQWPHYRLSYHYNSGRRKKWSQNVLDIQAAHDQVRADILHEEISNLGIPIYIRNLIFNLLSSRKIYVRNKSGEPIGPTNIHQGLSQGSPLNLCNSIYTQSTHHKINKPMQILQYADDIVLNCAGANIKLCYFSNRSLTCKSGLLLTVFLPLQ